MLVRAAARRTETSGALASPGVSKGTGITLPAPVHPVSSRGARETEPSLPASGGVARRRGPASSVDEDALLAKVLEAGVIPPSYRAWSFEETGMYRSAPTRRVYDLARERLGTVRPDEERAAMNGAGHD